MKYLVTGGEGFIGRNLRTELETAGNEVVTLDIIGNPEIKGSILDYDLVFKSTVNIDGVFHLAAVTSPPQFESNLDLGFTTNVNGTFNVLKASAENNVEKVVLASSSAIYGNISVPGKESMKVPGHENMYSTTKLIDEYIGKYFTLRNELEVVSMRFFNAYGAGENSKGMYSSVISKFLSNISRNEPPIIFGNGEQSRDFVYVEDIAGAAYQAMKKGRPGESYNVGTGVSNTFNFILSSINEVLGTNAKPIYQKNPFKNYQYFTQADTKKTERELRWKSEFDLSEGITKTARLMGMLN